MPYINAWSEIIDVTNCLVILFFYKADAIVIICRNIIALHFTYLDSINLLFNTIVKCQVSSPPDLTLTSISMRRQHIVKKRVVHVHKSNMKHEK